eukprot:CAMPEP_0174241300 /NCGR_PEP_ID=MMETSP0417-20130205/22750_1 /TAXON_ID=242541 /ORGANISM="Mayorella sp, Strain BSH-02190019" /LENGTH=36 /DNA_ID= /DNA_START= /DNA_END= /DNA_ORIENTATION=
MTRPRKLTNTCSFSSESMMNNQKVDEETHRAHLNQS